MKLGAVAIPLHAGEVEQIKANFRLWARPEFAPFDSPPADRPDLLIVFNSSLDPALSDDLRSTFYGLGLDAFFSGGISINFLGLNGEDDLYSRDYSKPVGEKGHKAGPNKQFFETLRLGQRFGRPYIFLMEADCIPIRRGWLDRVEQLCASPEEFWIMGSAYRGRGTIGEKYKRHINGNAIYAAGSPSFQKFASEVWQHQLSEIVRYQDRRVAYDCALEMLFSSMNSTDEDDPLWSYWKRTAHRFRYSSFIQNISARLDLEHPPLTLVSDILSNDTETFIIHSKVVADAALRGVEAEQFSPALWELEGLPPAPVLSAATQINFFASDGVLKNGNRFRLGPPFHEYYAGAIVEEPVEAGDELSLKVCFRIDRDAELAISLYRHGATPFEGTKAEPVSYPKGGHEVVLTHQFKSGHQAARVQFGSAGDVDLEILSVDPAGHTSYQLVPC